MHDHQFQILIQELQFFKDEIIKKLEEVRCGIIDVEEEIQNLPRKK